MVVAVALVVLGMLWFYLSVVATIVVMKARTYAALQRIGQLLIAWVVPFVGALFVLRVLCEHSPGGLARRLLPWPR